MAPAFELNMLLAQAGASVSGAAEQSAPLKHLISDSPDRFNVFSIVSLFVGAIGLKFALGWSTAVSCKLYT